jgi:hypothetical protein
VPDETLICPSCGARIPLTKALTGPIETRLRAALEEELATQSEALGKQENALKLREAKIDDQVRKKLEAQLPKLSAHIRGELSVEFDRRVNDLEGALKTTTARAERAEKEERELRKGRQQLEERMEALDLEVERKVDEARKAAELRIRGEIADANKLKDQEAQVREAGLLKQIAELQQKVEQGSQQVQGEALELEIEEELRRTFPTDLIEPVPAGTRGADIVQKVFTTSGQSCGSIVWETKRTKDWSDGWIGKLKEDQGRLNGDAAVLVSKALPEGVRSFSIDRGVVISTFACALPVASLVRLRLLEVARQKRVDQTSPEIREDLYRYLTSPEFVSRVENIVLPLAAMKEDLESERRALETRWRKRAREIEKAERSIGGIYGDLQGIVGRAKLPEVSRLALPESSDRSGGNTQSGDGNQRTELD